MKVRKSLYCNYYYSNGPHIPESDKKSSSDTESSSVSEISENDIDQSLEDKGNTEKFTTNEEAQDFDNLCLQSLETLEDNMDVTGLFPPQLLDILQNDEEMSCIFNTFFPEQSIPINGPYEHESRTVPVEQSFRECSKRRYIPQERSGDKLVPCKRLKSSVTETTGDGGGDRV